MIKLAKKKQIVISEEELVPTTLAVVQDKKESKCFWNDLDIYHIHNLYCWCHLFTRNISIYK